MPRAAVPQAGALERLPGCLRARPVFDEWHAVFQGAPETVSLLLLEKLGVEGVRCMRVPLEELFVELVGSDRLVEA